MPEIVPQNEVPSDHNTPPEAGQNVVPVARAQRLPADSHEATAELTQAVNEREEQLEADVDARHDAQAQKKEAAATAKQSKAAANDTASARTDDMPPAGTSQAASPDGDVTCRSCGTRNAASSPICKDCGTNIKV